VAHRQQVVHQLLHCLLPKKAKWVF
jgi:hypothetical protein